MKWYFRYRSNTISYFETFSISLKFVKLPFFPTEIQLNLKDKTPAPELASLKNDVLITKEIISRPEVQHPATDFL